MSTELTKLNKKQKLVLVARMFPKEVTTTVLWLNDQGLDVSCLELTPYFDQTTQTHYIQSSYIIPVAETKDLMVELRRTQQERKTQEVHVAKRQEDEITGFMLRVRAELMDRLPAELKPTKWSRWAGQWYSIRYYKYWYEDQWPWRNNDFCFATELETDAGKSHSGEVAVRFFVYATYLRGIGLSEEDVGQLRQFVDEFGLETGMAITQNPASFLVEKWVSADSLSEQGVSSVAGALADLIKSFMPRLQKVLDTVQADGPGVPVAVPATVGSDEEGSLAGSSS